MNLNIWMAEKPFKEWCIPMFRQVLVGVIEVPGIMVISHRYSCSNFRPEL